MQIMKVITGWPLWLIGFHLMTDSMGCIAPPNKENHQLQRLVHLFIPFPVVVAVNKVLLLLLLLLEVGEFGAAIYNFILDKRDILKISD